MNSDNVLEIKKIIQKIVNEEKPKTVKQLINKTAIITGNDEQEIYFAIQELEKNKIIRLGSPTLLRELPTTVNEYLFRNRYFSIEFWIIIFLICAFFPVGMLIPADSSFQFLRVIIGVLFGLFIPGWTITNLVFPKLYEKIDQLERVLIAVGMNIGIIIFSGLILNEIWLIDSVPFVIIIGSFTFLMHLLSVTVRILIGSNKIQIKLPKISTLRKKVRKDEK
ncbi:MAG: DUF1616 domain-containing protein [Candidatus Heimdallarchaeota archaeon]|nr:DUF1616 domain-containing protein [Candidatus Heimdallarchaeota archaeon]